MFIESPRKASRTSGGCGPSHRRRLFRGCAFFRGLGFISGPRYSEDKPYGQAPQPPPPPPPPKKKKKKKEEAPFKVSLKPKRRAASSSSGLQKNLDMMKSAGELARRPRGRGEWCPRQGQSYQVCQDEGFASSIFQPTCCTSSTPNRRKQGQGQPKEA